MRGDFSGTKRLEFKKNNVATISPGIFQIPDTTVSIFLKLAGKLCIVAQISNCDDIFLILKFWHSWYYDTFRILWYFSTNEPHCMLHLTYHLWGSLNITNTIPLLCILHSFFETLGTESKILQIHKVWSFKQKIGNWLKTSTCTLL